MLHNLLLKGEETLIEKPLIYLTIKPSFVIQIENLQVIIMIHMRKYFNYFSKNLVEVYVENFNDQFLCV